MLVEVRKYPDVQIVVERMDCGKDQSSRIVAGSYWSFP